MGTVEKIREFSDTTPLVECRAPNAKDVFINVKMSQKAIKRAAALGRTQILMEYWSLIRGEEPPINNIGKHENFRKLPLAPLKGAHALFQGLNRPCNGNNGEDVFIYIVKQTHAYKIIPDMVCMAKGIELPSECVLAVYVKFDNLDFSDDNSMPEGEILGWEFVASAKTDTMMPADASNRYNRRIW